MSASTAIVAATGVTLLLVVAGRGAVAMVDGPAFSGNEPPVSASPAPSPSESPPPAPRAIPSERSGTVDEVEQGQSGEVDEANQAGEQGQFGELGEANQLTGEQA